MIGTCPAIPPVWAIATTYRPGCKPEVLISVRMTICAQCRWPLGNETGREIDCCPLGDINVAASINSKSVPVNSTIVTPHPATSASCDSGVQRRYVNSVLRREALQHG